MDFRVKVKNVRDYLSRLIRHCSVLGISIWVPAGLLGLWGEKTIQVPWAIDLALFVCAISLIYALLRAFLPALIFTAAEVTVTNTFRRYRLQRSSILGYAWRPPPIFGRDNTPSVEFLYMSDNSVIKRVPAMNLPGYRAADIAESEGISEWPLAGSV